MQASSSQEGALPDSLSSTRPSYSDLSKGKLLRVWSLRSTRSVVVSTFSECCCVLSYFDGVVSEFFRCSQWKHFGYNIILHMYLCFIKHNLLVLLCNLLRWACRLGIPACSSNGNSRNVSRSKPSLHCHKRPREGALYKWSTRSTSDAMHVVLNPYLWFCKWTTLLTVIHYQLFLQIGIFVEVGPLVCFISRQVMFSSFMLKWMKSLHNKI